MKKKHHKIQSQKDYWIETLSPFTDMCLTKDEAKKYQDELAQRLSDLVKNNIIVDSDNGDKYSVCIKCHQEFY
tara:strand:+ start:934 stop:1152 length:219 start_codon:yes stop_codon:yes gene_type:complete